MDCRASRQTRPRPAPWVLAILSLGAARRSRRSSVRSPSASGNSTVPDPRRNAVPTRLNSSAANTRGRTRQTAPAACGRAASGSSRTTRSTCVHVCKRTRRAKQDEKAATASHRPRGGLVSPPDPFGPGVLRVLPLVGLHRLEVRLLRLSCARRRCDPRASHLAGPSTAQNPPRVLAVKLQNDINPVSADFVKHQSVAPRGGTSGGRSLPPRHARRASSTPATSLQRSSMQPFRGHRRMSHSNGARAASRRRRLDRRGRVRSAWLPSRRISAGRP